MNPARIVEMASVFYESCVLFAASDLGLFGKLAGLGEADAPTMAKACGLDPRRARLLLDACVALGLLAKEEDRYRNSPETAAFLVSGSPGDLSGAIRYNRDVYRAWGKLEEFARIIHEGKAVALQWMVGVNQAHQVTRSAQAIINIALLTGNIGRPGTGANSITGQV